MVGVTGNPDGYRLYADLASWWPLISAPQEYAEEAAEAATILNSAAIDVRDVLELGSGGGHNAVHLKRHFSLTLVDLSEDMLAVSRRLNPESWPKFYCCVKLLFLLDTLWAASAFFSGHLQATASCTKTASNVRPSRSVRMSP